MGKSRTNVTNVIAETIAILLHFKPLDQFKGLSGSFGPSHDTIFGSSVSCEGDSTAVLAAGNFCVPPSRS